MADIAQILGVGNKKKAPPTAVAAPSNAVSSGAQGNNAPNKAQQKLQGKSREVLGLLSGSTGGSEASSSMPLPPSVPGFPLQHQQQKLRAAPNEPGAVKVGNRWIKMQTPARKWAWAPFSSSSRTDGTLFHHWVRANVEYPDYPYARFDTHLDPVSYSEEEYQNYLTSKTWTKGETDRLMELARRLELRWPVIYDRWMELFHSDQYSNDNNSSPPKAERKIEDLQFRFYQVAAILNQVAVKMESATEAQMLAAATPDPSSEDPKTASDHLLYEAAAARQLSTMEGSQQPLIACPGTGTSNKVFDLEYERQRRAYLEAQWSRTKEDDTEEQELRRELKQIEAQLRKLKKSGSHIAALRKAGGAAVGGGGVGTSGSSPSSSRNNSRSVSPVPDAFGGNSGASPTSRTAQAAASGAAPSPETLDNAFASTAPIPTPGMPFLQSARLAPPATGGSSGLNKTLLSRMDAVLQELKVSTQPLPTKRTCDMFDAVRKDVLMLLLVQKNLLQKEGLLQSKRLRIAKLNGSAVVTEESVMGLAASSASAAATATVTSSAANVTSSSSSSAVATSRPETAKAKGGGKTASSAGSKTAKGQKKVAAGVAMSEESNPLDPAAVPSGVPQQQPPSAQQQQLQQQQPQAQAVKPAPTGKQGKQAKKAATKRKRKADGAGSGKQVAAAAASAAAAGGGDTANPAESVAAAPLAAEAPKSSGKKRPRKSASQQP